MGVLAAPVQRARACYDGKLNIRDCTLLVRRTVAKDVPLRPRPPGHYITATNCPYASEDHHHQPVTEPGALDRHLIQDHQGSIPPEWVEPPTVPAGGQREVIYPVGVSASSQAATDKVIEEYPKAAEHLKAQRIARGLFTAHMRGGPFPRVAMPHAAPLAAEVVEGLKALQAAGNQHRRAQRALAMQDPAKAERLNALCAAAKTRHRAYKAVASTDPEAAERLKAEWREAQQALVIQTRGSIRERRAQNQRRWRANRALFQDPKAAAELKAKNAAYIRRYRNKQAAQPHVTDPASPSTQQASQPEAAHQTALRVTDWQNKRCRTKRLAKQAGQLIVTDLASPFARKAGSSAVQDSGPARLPQTKKATQNRRYRTQRAAPPLVTDPVSPSTKQVVHPAGQGLEAAHLKALRVTDSQNKRQRTKRPVEQAAQSLVTYLAGPSAQQAGRDRLSSMEHILINVSPPRSVVQAAVQDSGPARLPQAKKATQNRRHRTQRAAQTLFTDLVSPSTQEVVPPAVQGLEAVHRKALGVTDWQNKRQRTKRPMRQARPLADPAGILTQHAALHAVRPPQVLVPPSPPAVGHPDATHASPSIPQASPPATQQLQSNLHTVPPVVAHQVSADCAHPSSTQHGMEDLMTFVQAENFKPPYNVWRDVPGSRVVQPAATDQVGHRDADYAGPSSPQAASTITQTFKPQYNVWRDIPGPRVIQSGHFHADYAGRSSPKATSLMTQAFKPQYNVTDIPGPRVIQSGHLDAGSAGSTSPQAASTMTQNFKPQYYVWRDVGPRTSRSLLKE